MAEATGASLNRAQRLALLQEAQSAQNLLRDSVDAIRKLQYTLIGADAVLTLGSIGVEKTLKLLLGCAHAERFGSWPSKPELKQWGHDIEVLSSLLQETIEANVDQAVARPYARGLADFMAGSELLPPLFATLSRYGRSARFHYLDILATGEQGDFDAPQQYWDALERKVVEVTPGMSEAPLGGPDFDAHLLRISAITADELYAWWYAVHRLGQQRVFGDLGVMVGIEIWPGGVPRPSRPWA